MRIVPMQQIPFYGSSTTRSLCGVLGSALLTMAGACSFDGSGVAPGDASTNLPDTSVLPDAMVDGSILPDAAIPDAWIPDAAIPDAAPDATPCPGSVLALTPSNIDPCAILAPTGDLVLSTGTWFLNTNNTTLRDSNNNTQPLTAVALAQTGGGPEVLVVSVNNLSIGNNASLRATGTRPLIIVALQNATISGTISVGGAGNGDGAGGGTDCTVGTGEAGAVQTDGNGNNGGSGGGGGGFGVNGEVGAKIADEVSSGTTSKGGQAEGNDALTPLRGGCSGGAGGNAGGAGGGAGGAIQLVAGGTITVGPNGQVTARGGFGSGAAGDGTSGGGGGGGSGGAILIEAPTIQLQGQLIANGGGGGEGAAGNAAGANGLDGQPSVDGASGGSGGDGGDGGIGGARNIGAGPGQEGATPDGTATAAHGGGGGGGAVGRIHLRGIVQTSGNPVISPDFTIP